MRKVKQTNLNGTDSNLSASTVEQDNPQDPAEEKLLGVSRPIQSQSPGQKNPRKMGGHSPGNRR